MSIHPPLYLILYIPVTLSFCSFFCYLYVLSLKISKDIAGLDYFLNCDFINCDVVAVTL